MRGLAQVTVVSMLADVEHADRYGRAFEAGQLDCKPARQMISVGENPDEHEAVDAPVAFRDLVRDSRQGSPNLVGIHHRRLEPLLGDAHPRRRSRSAMRTWRPL